MKVGDLVCLKGNHKILYHVIRGEYTARFMEGQDYEMERCGMGEHAGVYASAIDVVALSGPRCGQVSKRQKMSCFERPRQ